MNSRLNRRQYEQANAGLILLFGGLVLICHSSYRGVVELLRDLFDTSISVGTVHNRLQATAEAATAINQTQVVSTQAGGDLRDQQKI